MSDRKIVNLDMVIGSTGNLSNVSVDGRRLLVTKATVVVEKNLPTTIALECLRFGSPGEGEPEPLVVKGKVLLDPDSADPADVTTKDEFLAAIRNTIVINNALYGDPFKD